MSRRPTGAGEEIPPRGNALLRDARAKLEADASARDVAADYIPKAAQAGPKVLEALENLCAQYPGAHADLFADARQHYGLDQEWAQPIPLDPEPPQDLPADLLPSPLREQVDSVAGFAQVPTALPVSVGLAAVSAAVAGKAEVEIRSGWHEPLNLYTAVVLDPANRKSAVESEMMAPLRAWEQEQACEKGPAERAALDRREALQKRLKQAKRELSKADTPQTEGNAREKMCKARRRLEDHEVPHPPRLLTNDVTPEALGRLMAEQHGRAAIVSSEGDVLRIFAGKYSSGDPTLDLLKKAWSGDPVRVDRVGRDGVRLPKPLLTVGLTLQETLLDTLSNRDVLAGEGVLARFLWMAPPSMIGSRLTGADVPAPDRCAQLAYERLLRGLLSLEPAAVNEDGSWTPHTLCLSPRARNEIEHFEGEVEGMLADGGDLASVRGWGGKLVGNTIRVAGLLHIVEHVGQGADPFSAAVSGETMAAAVRLGQALVPHALHVLASDAGMDSELELARYVLRRMREADDPELTERDLWQLTRGKAAIEEMADLREVLHRLEAHRLVRVEERQSTGGRPPSSRVRLNPHERREIPRSPRSPPGDVGAPTSGASGDLQAGSFTDQVDDEVESEPDKGTRSRQCACGRRIGPTSDICGSCWKRRKEVETALVASNKIVTVSDGHPVTLMNKREA